MNSMSLCFHKTIKHQTVEIDMKIAKRILLLMSLFAGFMSGHLYSKSFLSSLVAGEYEHPIDTIGDLLASNLTMYYPEKTAVEKYLAEVENKELREVCKLRG